MRWSSLTGIDRLQAVLAAIAFVCGVGAVTERAWWGVASMAFLFVSQVVQIGMRRRDRRSTASAAADDAS